MRTRAAVAMLVLLGSLGACGQASPVSDDPGFTTAGGDVRLVARYDQSARDASYRVTVPAGFNHVRVHMDCVAESSRMITVRVGSLGATAVPCGPDSTEGGALIGLSGEKVGRAGKQRVTVTVPKRARWSFAVDAG